ncbi:type II secretion system F family protein [Krasilnikovia sp. M28-CT-15]|uniref:type II secretion system F family protein n=1 Tax=Krasilnikovia sp. M28-CT-15 TaxID=3373540 RepID=UPI003875E254
MTADRFLLAACLVAGALVAAWPGMRANRHRLHPSTRGHPLRPRGGRERLPSPILAELRSALQAWPTALAGQPLRVVAVAGGLAAIAGWLVAGLVAGLVAAVYAALGCRALTRGMARRAADTARSQALDDLCALAADLRAGKPPPVPMSAGSPAASAEPDDGGPGPLSADPERRRIAELTEAVWHLAERTGAPAADLVERLEADVRAGVRARSSAAAQAAGAQATALLLAALPLGGIALGYAIGADPLRVLLHTPLGAVCALGAAALQSVGLLWADRLATGSAP